MSRDRLTLANAYQEQLLAKKIDIMTYLVKGIEHSGVLLIRHVVVGLVLVL